MSHVRALPIAVGVDVAKATLSVHVRRRNGADIALSIGNTETDISRVLAGHLKGYRGKVVLESTGHYHWLAALLFSEAGCDVRIINPILGKKYTNASIRKVKTDPVDARMLAEMCLKEEHLPPRFAFDRRQLMLRKKIGFISSLSKEVAALNAMVKSLQEAKAILGSETTKAEADILATIGEMKRDLRRLEREFEREVIEDAEPQVVERLTSIPGVSTHAAALALHWFSRVQTLSAKSWVAFAGLDVSVRQSGMWRGRGKLTKRGNSNLRRRLFCAAWGAVMNDAQFRSYYAELKKQGRSHVEAMLMIARKIVRLMHHLLTADTAYDPMKAFAAIR